MKKKDKTDMEVVAEIRNNAVIPLTPEVDRALKVAISVMHKDIPSGTVRDPSGAERCMMCRRTVGMSAYYCKWCGQKIREVPDWVRIPFQE